MSLKPKLRLFQSYFDVQNWLLLKVVKHVNNIGDFKKSKNQVHFDYILVVGWIYLYNLLV